MDNSKKNIIKEIAENLDCGFDCYYNPKTNEIITIPNFEETTDEEEFKDAFQSDINKVDEQKENFIKFEVLESFESFKIMERFTDQIGDKKFQSELDNILQNRKPFQNFKHSIDNSDYRQNWFDFKQNELEKIVEQQLNRGK